MMKSKKHTEHHPNTIPTEHTLSVLPSLKQMEIVTLPREVLKWIQSLDLTYSVKNVKKDFNNGFLIAQILSRYYPVTTDDKVKNLKAIPMHQISNGFSTEVKRDNWTQIRGFIRKIGENNLEIDDIERFTKNENDEILTFIIKMYQELTRKKVPLLEGKKIKTDIDDINKSYLLKDTGEVELLKKDTDLNDKKLEDLQKSISKRYNILIFFRNQCEFTYKKCKRRNERRC
jgi:hypothetical protein